MVIATKPGWTGELRASKQLSAYGACFIGFQERNELYSIGCRTFLQKKQKPPPNFRSPYGRGQRQPLELSASASSQSCCRHYSDHVIA